jgi:hypothetical protein
MHKGDVAISLCLHDELYVGVDALGVQQEVIQFSTSTGPDHGDIIETSEPTQWFVGNALSASSSNAST